jgi:hypothetical protein
MTTRERTILNYFTSEVHDEDYDRMLFVVDSDDYPDEAQFLAARQGADALADRYGIAYEVSQQAYPAPTVKNGPRWERLSGALEGDPRPVVYYALLLPGGTRENPSGLLRRVRGPINILGHSVGADGRWRFTSAVVDRVVRGTSVGDFEELTVDEAAGVLERWRSAGAVTVFVDEYDAPEIRACFAAAEGQE